MFKLLENFIASSYVFIKVLGKSFMFKKFLKSLRLFIVPYGAVHFAGIFNIYLKSNFLKVFQEFPR